MATLDRDGSGLLSSPASVIKLPRLSWLQILAISIFYLALNFHWAALGLITLPSQVFKIVGELHKGEALAFVLVPGAFVSLFANPLFGLLSDNTRGRLAVWGKRRPYILIGTLVNVGALIWMALSTDIISLALGFILVQFSSNAAQAPFHALLPDVVPPEQRGITSGIMGMLVLVGNIAGVIIAGMLINASHPPQIYQQELWLTYGIIIATLLVFMLITIFSVRESTGISAQLAERKASESVMPANEKLVATRFIALCPPARFTRPSWLTPSLLRTVGATLLVIAVVWGLMALWNAWTLRPESLRINDSIQQVVLELIATVGLLRLFEFSPRRTPDFAWVLLTRLIVMMGIYTIQTYLQYYMQDAIGVRDPEGQTRNFIILVSLTSLASSLVGGWLSDKFGRKRLVYVSGGFMGAVGLIFVLTQSLPLVIMAGAIFGIGYGAYTSVDWALVADVLPSHRSYARDMGVWNISLSLPQVIAPALGGPLIDFFVKRGQPVIGYQLLFIMAIVYCLVGSYLVRYVRGIKN